MKKFPRIIALVCLVVIGLNLSSCTSSKRSVLLRYNPKLGETISSTVIIKQKVGVDGQSPAFPVTTEIIMTMDMTATDKADTLVTTNAQLKSMSFKSSMMGQTMYYDTDHLEELNPESAKILEELKKKTFEIVFDIYGKTISVPEDYPNKDMKFAPILPKEKVSKGSQWTVELDTKINDMEIHSIDTYTVKKITKKETEIEMNGIIASEICSGNLTGNMTIDNETGLTTFWKMTMPLSMTLSANGVPYKSTLLQTITLTIEKP